MSFSSIKPSFYMKNETSQIFGIPFKEKRLVFQDPYESSGKILSHQIKRWRKDQVNSKEGIKTHSKVMHIFWKVIHYITFGYINKSIAVVLDNRKFYLDTGSLQKWRRFNHEDLLSLAILKSATRSDLAKTRQEELTALNQLLKLLPKDRPQRKKTMRECDDFFELSATALQLAREKVNACHFSSADQEKLEKATYAIGAFYILLTSEITVPACGEEMLQVASRLTARNLAASEDEFARLVNTGHEHLENKVKELEQRRRELEKNHQNAELVKKEEQKARMDSILFDTIREAYEDTEDGIRHCFLNKAPDIFSSLQTRNNPVLTKKLLNQILKKNEKFTLNFTNKLLNYLIKGKEMPGNCPQEWEFFQHIMSLGKALKEQFTVQDPGTLLKPLLQNAFLQITPIMTSENQIKPELLNKIGTLTAWNLLKSQASITTHSDTSETLTCVLEEPLTLSIHFPPKNLYDNQDCTQMTKLPFVNALAGKLACDADGTPVCYDEALDFVKGVNELFSEELVVLDELVKRRALNPLEKEQGHKAPEAILEEIWKELYSQSELAQNFLSARERRLNEYEDGYASTSSYDQEAYYHLVTLYNKLEKIGELIRYRYFGRYGNEFLDKIEFEGSGIKIDPGLLEGALQFKRTAAEHKKMIQAYFPGYDIKQMPKKEPPKFKPREHLKVKPANYVSSLFNSLHNNTYEVAQGSCCVGALAQGIFKKKSACTEEKTLQAIRNAACSYMKSHPEQFLDTVCADDASNYSRDAKIESLSQIKNLSEQQKEKLKNLQKERVVEFADSLAHSEWFNMAAMKALSLILERPIYVVDAKSGHNPYRLEENGCIEMQKINPHLDGEILYLRQNSSRNHFDCLMPKRAGTTNIR